MSEWRTYPAKRNTPEHSRNWTKAKKNIKKKISSIIFIFAHFRFAYRNDNVDSCVCVCSKSACFIPLLRNNLRKSRVLLAKLLTAGPIPHIPRAAKLLLFCFCCFCCWTESKKKFSCIVVVRGTCVCDVGLIVVAPNALGTFFTLSIRWFVRFWEFLWLLLLVTRYYINSVWNSNKIIVQLVDATIERKTK